MSPEKRVILIFLQCGLVISRSKITKKKKKKERTREKKKHSAKCSLKCLGRGGVKKKTNKQKEQKKG